MALKDSAGLVKSYAMLNIEKYQNVAIGDTVSECEDNYVKMLSEMGVITEQPKEEQQVSGVITRMVQTVVDGNSHYYITLEGVSGIFDVLIAENPEIIMYNAGDTIKFSYIENGKFYEAVPLQ